MLKLIFLAIFAFVSNAHASEDELTDAIFPRTDPYRVGDYSETSEKIQKPTSFAQFALLLILRDHILLELGCGNGRDAFYFARASATKWFVPYRGMF